MTLDDELDDEKLRKFARRVTASDPPASQPAPRSSRGPRESSIERGACEALKRGALAVKLNANNPPYGGHAGKPDRLIVAPGGVMFFIEFKKRGGKLTPLQTHFHRDLERRGAPVFTATSVEEALAIYDRMTGVAGRKVS